MPLVANTGVTVFVYSLMFSCADFWAVKNITGRRILGLRWWISGELPYYDVVGPVDQ